MQTFLVAKGEWLLVGEQVRIGVLGVKGRRVRLGFIAPATIPILRKGDGDKTAAPAPPASR